MILLLSNRDIHPDDLDNEGCAGESYFGEELANPDGSGLSLALADYHLDEDDDPDFDEDVPDHSPREPHYCWSLSPIASTGEAALFADLLSQIDSGELSKKWVFFVHGNNQTTRKNLEKCRRIQQLHCVNVIAFSWPSWGRLFSGNLFTSLLPLLVKSGLSTLAVANALGKSLIKEKQNAYKKAVKHAELSRHALHSALQRIHSDFITPARNNHSDFSVNLLVHSLGNRVVEHLINDNSLPDLVTSSGAPFFDNAIFHQADVSEEAHRVWLSQVRWGKRHYVTHNKKDIVLHISDIFGHNDKRLGHALRGPAVDSVSAYIDYSRGRRVGWNHGLFLLTDSTNEKVNDCFTALLNGEALFTGNHLPLGFVHKQANQFSMKAEPQSFNDDQDFDIMDY